MKPARIAILAIALAAGLGAAFLMSGEEPPAPTAPAPVVQAPSIKTTEVLVASGEMPMGHAIREEDLRWQAWPDESVSAGLITRPDAPTAVAETAGAIARSAFLPGEPIRKEKIIKTDGSGFMSAILPAGMRAMAISIDTRGATSAGGFILPNDRVDVIRTTRDEEASKATSSEVQVSETILTNVRVLAIGQQVEEKGGEKVVTGETATLELTPEQVEVVTHAQKVGQLTLALRSLADANRPDPPREEGEGLTVIRYGIAKQANRR